jgi:hypothetical protein
MSTSILRNNNLKICYTLKHPKGYYVLDTGSVHILYRPNGKVVWRFNPAAVLECEIKLTAFEDHSEQMLSTAESKN